MKLTELFTEERAVSPVLGVALLIAITVILAGVVGFVVLGVDTQGTDAPSAQLNFQQDGADNIDVAHDGGDPIINSSGQIKITTIGTATVDADGLAGTLRTGQTEQIATGAATGDEVKIIWQDPDSDREVLLGEYTAE